MADSSHRMMLCIADMTVTLDLAGCDNATRAHIAERYDAFSIVAGQSLFLIRVRIEEGAAFIPTENAPTWQIRTQVRYGRVDFESHYEKGWMDRATGQGELVMRPQGDPENFLRVMYARLCLEQNGLLIHAAGVIRQGRGYVFFGASGSGKTTLTRLSLDYTVLSDDLVIVKKRDSVFRVSGVPFRGDLPEAPRNNASADLRGLFTLVKAAEHRLAPLAAPEAVARLSACAPFVMEEARNTQQVLDICWELATRVGVNALHFRRDSDFWEVIDGLERVSDSARPSGV